MCQRYSEMSNSDLLYDIYYNLISPDLTWSHLISPDLTWSHLISPDMHKWVKSLWLNNAKNDQTLPKYCEVFVNAVPSPKVMLRWIPQPIVRELSMHSGTSSQSLVAFSGHSIVTAKSKDHLGLTPVIKYSRRVWCFEKLCNLSATVMLWQLGTIRFPMQCAFEPVGAILIFCKNQPMAVAEVCIIKHFLNVVGWKRGLERAGVDGRHDKFEIRPWIVQHIGRIEEHLPEGSSVTLDVTLVHVGWSLWIVWEGLRRGRGKHVLIDQGGTARHADTGRCRVWCLVLDVLAMLLYSWLKGSTVLVPFSDSRLGWACSLFVESHGGNWLGTVDANHLYTWDLSKVLFCFFCLGGRSAVLSICHVDCTVQIALNAAVKQVI